MKLKEFNLLSIISITFIKINTRLFQFVNYEKVLYFTIFKNINIIYFNNLLNDKS